MTNLLNCLYGSLDPQLFDAWAFQSATAHGVVLTILTNYVAILLVNSGVTRFSTTAPSTSNFNYWKERTEKDKGSITNNPHILAERITKRGTPITHSDINQVLANENSSITESELKELKEIKVETYSLKDLASIKTLFPKDTIKLWGIYMLVNNVSGLIYVGSSTHFGLRLLHYLKNSTQTNLRLVLQNIRDTKIANFTLQYYRIPLHLQEERLLHGLEQYYILSLNPGLNTLKVVNGIPGGMRISAHNSQMTSVPIYVSISDQIVYIFDSLNGITNNAMTGLNASTNTIINCLDNDTLFLGIYQLSRIRPNNLSELETVLMTREEIINHVNKVRLSKIIYTPPITIVRLLDNTTFNFINFNEARKWILLEIGTKVSNKTMYSRMKSGVALNGYIYKPSQAKINNPPFYLLKI